MFGIGPQEMGIIALFALIIFGPGKLPEVMKQAGTQYRKFKGLADEMTGELNKVTAEARKELDGAFGDLGPMGKDLEKSLGVKSSTPRTTSTGTKSTPNAARKATTTSSTKKTTTGSSKSTTSSAAKSTSATKASTSTATAKASTKAVVATKEDPLADFAMFEGEKRESRKRVRTAAPSAITDLTPRAFFEEVETEVAVKTPEPIDLSTLDDPIARARARRRTAGYARA